MNRILQVGDSSNIKLVGYDFDEMKMIIEFQSGKVYRYTGVTAPVFGQLAGSDSIGAAFNSLVRDKFETTELTATVS
jgi:hypothetical protein